MNPPIIRHKAGVHQRGKSVDTRSATQNIISTGVEAAPRLSDEALQALKWAQRGDRWSSELTGGDKDSKHLKHTITEKQKTWYSTLSTELFKSFST